MTFQTSAGVGASVPDNENVESAAVGKVEGMFNIGDYISIGLGFSQSGNYKQNEVPADVQLANANPQAFSGPGYYHHGGDVIIINDTDIAYITPTIDPLPKRPTDRTEKNIWTAEPIIQLGVPIWFSGIMVKPYVRGMVGAGGVKTWDGASRVGLSKGLGCGVDVKIRYFLIGLEATRRHIETNLNTYGSNQFLAKAGLLF